MDKLRNPLKILAASVLLAGASPLPVSAGISDFSTATTGALSRACQPVRNFQRGEQMSGEQELVVGVCYGYFLAEADGDPIATPLYCPPDRVTVEQRALIFLKWADENPEHHNMDRSVGVKLALMSAFPCPN